MNVDKRKLFHLIWALPALVGLGLLPGPYKLGLGGRLLAAYGVAVVTVLAVGLLAWGARLFLWRVGRRLAFSYFLAGVVPIPVVGLLLLVATYIANGYFLVHLYRDALHSVASELRFAACSRLDQLLNQQLLRRPPPIQVAFAYYRDGIKFGGAAEAPARWQPWWVDETIDTVAPSPLGVTYVALTDGAPTLMAAMSEDRYGVLALFDGDLERELAERTGVWTELRRSDEGRRSDEAAITVRHRDYYFSPPLPDGKREDLQDFFHPGVRSPSLWDRPLLVWVDGSSPFYDLKTGTVAADYVAATLTGSLRTVGFHLLSHSSAVRTSIFVVMVMLAIVLFDVWVLAAAMALLMIFGLSRAVNRLYRGTQAVQGGDFSSYIEVRRNDQIGALQRSFNQMSANLEALIASAAQKEVLENELSIARELQQSLLPGELASEDGVRFATHFEPSAAIGGDYYDLLPMAGGRLAVVVADVSGHGLSAGLRMAMIKSALQLLCEQECRPEEILCRLHRLQRGGGDHRGFVTATLALIDPATGELVVTNAGHPPTYLLRAGRVTEIALPSTPLGGLGDDFGKQSHQLEPGDVVVWLSDGLIEAVDHHQEPFGYDRIVASLEGLEPDATAVRDRLLAAIDAYAGGDPPDDDRTLVVMAYHPADGGQPSSVEVAPEPPSAVSPSVA